MSEATDLIDALKRLDAIDGLKPVMLTDKNGMTGWFLDVDDVRQVLWGNA